FAVAGVLAATTCLTKYNYGGFLVAALVGVALGRPDRRRALGALLAPVVVIVGAWLALEPVRKLEGLVGFAVNRASGVPFLSRENLVTYPKAFLLDFSP